MFDNLEKPSGLKFDALPQDQREHEKDQSANRAKDQTAAEIRMDINTPLEWFFLIAGLLGLITLIALLVSPSHEQLLPYTTLAVIFTVLSFYTRVNIDCTYIIDNSERVILYRRTIFSYVSNRHIANFSDVHSVAVPGKRTRVKGVTYWGYKIILILKSGEVITIKDGYMDSKGFEAAGILAKALATHLESDFFKGVEDKAVEVTVNPGSGKLNLNYVDGTRPDTAYVYFLLAFAVLLAAAIIFTIYLRVG
jgi:hypothetical protein